MTRAVLENVTVSLPRVRPSCIRSTSYSIGARVVAGPGEDGVDRLHLFVVEPVDVAIEMAAMIIWARIWPPKTTSRTMSSRASNGAA